MTQFTRPLAVLFVVLCLPKMLPAQATVDLKSGTEAMQAGNLEPARILLESAALNLPESVEAQFTLAECYLKLGQLNEAMDQYRKVLQLSPDHVQARAIITALSGRNRNFDRARFTLL